MIARLPPIPGRDWTAITAVYRQKVEAGLDTETFYAEMQAMLNELGDEHSQFELPVLAALPEAELADGIEFVGVGISVLPQPEKGQAVVVAVFPDSPACAGHARAF